MINKVAVIGAGIMGHGIAQTCAQAGCEVILTDISASVLQDARKKIEKNVEVMKDFYTEEQRKNVLENITFTEYMEEAANADIVIEAIPEILELKHNLYKKLESIVRDECIIASNTSTLPVSQLASGVERPERMIITHFFNPAQLVPLVEIVKHEKTKAGIVDKTKDFMERIGKTPILLKKEVAGFVANRLQAAVVREAFYLFNEGVADAGDIDKAITEGPGFRWAFNGPLKTADYGGLDVWKSVMGNLAPLLDTRKEAPDVILQAVEAGNLGAKTGKGIFEYTEDEVEQSIKQRDESLVKLLSIKESNKN